MSEVVYYCNSYSLATFANPSNEIDGSLSTFATATANNQSIQHDANTCPGINLGTITKVEFRVYAKRNSGTTDFLRMLSRFSETNGDSRDWTLPGSASWSSYYDITTDTNAPTTWSWSDVVACDIWLQFKRTSAGDCDAYKTEIRITYTPNEASASDGVVFGESRTPLANRIAAGSDGVGLGENRTGRGDYATLANDGMIVSEQFTVLANRIAVASDGFTTSELATFLAALSVMADDSFVVSEIVAPIASVTVSISDRIIVGEILDTIVSRIASVADGFSIAEVVSLALIASAVDGLAVGESASPVGSYSVTANDAAVLSEGSTAIGRFIAAVADGVSFSELADYLRELAVGNVCVTFTAASATISFAAAAPTIDAAELFATITATGNAPAVSATGNAPTITGEINEC